MQDVQPSSALKLSPIPQLLHRMNKHGELLSGKAAPLSLSLSPLLFFLLLGELRATLLQMER